MGFFYKHFVHPLMSRVVDRKAMTNNPYLGLVLDADESDVIADELFRVSMAYQQGQYMLPQDDKKAKEYCQKAAERGHVIAQLFMAQWLMRFSDDNNKDVMDWLIKAADQGERQSLYNLGISYHRGDIDGKVNIKKSLPLFRRSAEKLYGPSCATIAIFWAWEAHLNGDKEDGGLFSHLMQNGDVVNDQLNWKKVYGEAAENGERFAYHVMGIAYSGEQDLEKAKECWSKASELGCIQSMYNLGILLQREGKNEDAIKLYMTPAEQGDEMAQYALASMLYYGNGVDKDVKKAWYWNEKALNFGFTPARYLLAVMCMQNSMNDILPDKVMRGASYMEQAAMNGYEPAINFYNAPKK